VWPNRNGTQPHVLRAGVMQFMRSSSRRSIQATPQASAKKKERLHYIIISEMMCAFQRTRHITPGRFPAPQQVEAARARKEI